MSSNMDPWVYQDADNEVCRNFLPVFSGEALNDFHLRPDAHNPFPCRRNLC